MWLNVRGLVQPLAEDFGGLRLQTDLDRQRNRHQRQRQDEERERHDGGEPADYTRQRRGLQDRDNVTIACAVFASKRAFVLGICAPSNSSGDHTLVFSAW